MDDFFKPKTLLGLGVATAAVVAIVNALQSAFNVIFANWVILVIAIFVSGCICVLVYRPAESGLRNLGILALIGLTSMAA